jgi:hypothetical protein
MDCSFSKQQNKSLLIPTFNPKLFSFPFHQTKTTMRSETPSLTFVNNKNAERIFVNETQFPDVLKEINWKSNLSLLIPESKIILHVNTIVFKIIKIWGGSEVKTIVEFYNSDQTLLTSMVFLTKNLTKSFEQFIDILPEKMTAFIDSISRLKVRKAKSNLFDIDLQTDFDGTPQSPSGKFLFTSKVVDQLNNWLKYVRRSEPVQFWDNTTKSIIDVSDGSPRNVDFEYWQLNLLSIVYVPINETKTFKLSDVIMDASYDKIVYFYSLGDNHDLFRFELNDKHFCWFFNVALFVIPYFVDTPNNLHFGGENVNRHPLWSKFPFGPVILKPLLHPSNFIMINDRKVMLYFTRKINYQRYRTISLLTNDQQYQKFDPKLSKDVKEFRVFQSAIDFSIHEPIPIWIKLSESHKYAYDFCQSNDTSETLIRVYLKDEPAFCGAVPFNPDFKNFLDNKGISFIPTQPVAINTNNEIKVINRDDGKITKYTRTIINFPCFSHDEKIWIFKTRIGGYHINDITKIVTLYEKDIGNQLRVLLQFDLSSDVNNEFYDFFVVQFPQYFSELDEPKLSKELLTVQFRGNVFSLEQFFRLFDANRLTYSVFDSQTLVFKNPVIRQQIETLYLLSFPSTLKGSFLISDVHQLMMNCPSSEEMKSFKALLGDKFVEPIPKFTHFDLQTLSFQHKGERCDYLDSIIHNYEKIDTSQIIIDMKNSGNANVWLTDRNKFCYLLNPKIAQTLDDMTKSDSQNKIVGIIRMIAPTKIITLGKDSLIVIDSKNQTYMISNVKISIEILKTLFPSTQFIEN